MEDLERTKPGLASKIRSLSWVVDGDVGIVDATGRVVARVGDEVEFSAFDLTYQQAMEQGGLEEISPACSGAYWAVGEEFTASAPDAP